MYEIRIPSLVCCLYDYKKEIKKTERKDLGKWRKEKKRKPYRPYHRVDQECPTHRDSCCQSSYLVPIRFRLPPLQKQKRYSFLSPLPLLSSSSLLPKVISPKCIPFSNPVYPLLPLSAPHTLYSDSTRLSAHFAPQRAWILSPLPPLLPQVPGE